jgi:hypothetical protein
MLFAKIAGILIMVWFYQTAKKQQENGLKWAITGLVGYWLVWWIVTLSIANPLLETFERSSALIQMSIGIIPAMAAIIVALFIRKKFLVDAFESKNQ